jgi:hypothetical protein
MSDNIFEKMTEEERTFAWMYMMINKDKIIEKTEQLTKEAEKRGMINDLCKSCINTGCEFQSGIVRTKCAFYMPPIIDADLDIDEEIEKFENNAEFERTHENLRGCQEFKKLAEWLKELKAYKEQEPCADAISRKTVCAKITNGAYPGESTEQCIENGQKAYKRTTGWVSDTI